MGKRNPLANPYQKAIKPIGNLFFRPLRILGLPQQNEKNEGKGQPSPGAPPGIEHYANANTPPERGHVIFRLADVSPEKHQDAMFDSIEDLIASERPPWSKWRWIDIQGSHPYVIKQLKRAYGLHTLAAEDTLSVPQRPKVENYENSLFIIMRMLRKDDNELVNEQVNFFLLDDGLITIQEEHGDVWNPVRERLKRPGSRFCQYGPSYLLYALIDAIVDHVFPLLDRYFESIDQLEQKILRDPQPDDQSRIHAIKRELVYLRQALWPMRDTINALLKDEFDLLPPEVETYFRDVHDHSIQAIDAVEVYRETARGLQDLLMASASNRMNEVMKALTIMAALFLPITFLAGVYGMNFEYIPELGWRYGYHAFWGICLAATVVLLWYFKRKRWI